jgi:hypothetical protein
LLSQTISSGSGALSMAIGFPRTVKSLSGRHGEQKNCFSFWRTLGRKRKMESDYCFEKMTMANRVVLVNVGSGVGWN